MQFLLDENQHAKLVPFFASIGHEARFAKKGTPDDEIVRIAKKENRMLITYDKDFANINKFPLSAHRGILLLRINPLFLPVIKERLIVLLAEWSEERLRSTAVAVFEDRIVDLTEDVFEV